LDTNIVCAYKKRMSIPETTMHMIFCQVCCGQLYPLILLLYTIVIPV
jgi:hypothetical protein